MSLRDQILTDISSVFFNRDDFATSITIRSGGRTIVSDLTAIADSTAFEATSSFGHVRYDTRDFLVETSKLPCLPSSDWTITEGTEQYRFSTNTDGHPWRYEDDDRVLIRMHTTRMGTR